MARKERRDNVAEGILGLGGLLGGLGSVLEKLGELAEKGKELHESGEFGEPGGKVRGVYGFKIKMGVGGEGVEVQPFGNVRKDEETGRATVQEVREPMVDVFEEQDRVLVVAEMPGVGDEDVQLEVKDDILTIAAGKGDKKYRKEVLLPASFPPDKMTHSCRNGVLEVKFTR